MQTIEGRAYYSASDLNNYLECAHLTSLDLQVAMGGLVRPEKAKGTAELVAQLGIAHEQRYLEGLRAGGRAIVELPDKADQTVVAMQAAEAATVAAMAAGAPIIYQAAFFDGTFFGRADFLLRVETASGRWPYSYEVLDTKLALHTQPYFLIQLCHYSEHLARLQGTPPAQMYVLLGSGRQEALRVGDYAAYYRQLRRSFLRDVEAGAGGTYPVPTDHCAICRWIDACELQRRDDDYLRLVAWMRNDQVARFRATGITTVAQLAVAPDESRPVGMNPTTFERLRRQAALQMRQRATGAYHYELLDPAPWLGFGQLPAPAAGDVFFDMEGDPLFEIGVGLEYLFGMWLPDDEPRFRCFWGTDRSAEKTAFENFIDFIVERRARFPAMHVYHYADYEKTALRKLAQRHRTREDEVDDLLRAEVFVDLYAVVRQALVISQESYSIKSVEKFYDFKRTAGVGHGDESIVQFEKWRADPSDTAILASIEEYNKEDCDSTWQLREWLLKLRGEANARRGSEIPFRPLKQAGTPCHVPPVEGCKKCDKRVREEREEARTTALQHRFLDDLPPVQTEADLRGLTDEQRARFLFGNLLAYHRREDKPVFWRFFDRCENADNLVEFDHECLGGLELDTSIAAYKVTPRDQNIVHSYRFPDQQYGLRPGDSVNEPQSRKDAGEIIEIDENNRVVKLKLSKNLETRAADITALIPNEHVPSETQKVALQRIGEEYLAGTLASQALLDLLLSATPRFVNRVVGSRIQPAHVDEHALYELISHLDSSTLFIQGPPGTGKSTKAAAVIVRLLDEGKCVGVMSNSHKAIHGLNRKVEEKARETGVSFRGVHKASKKNQGSEYVSPHGLIGCEMDNKPIDDGDFAFISGNAWLFARDAMIDRLDYLFIDEAGQIALADALAVAPAAANIVVIGDPLQLAQVSQGVHPVGVGVSVLEHLLGPHSTVPEDRGVFLDVTYRLHPSICTFISDELYDGRLKPDPDTARQSIGALPALGNGLRYLPVRHAGDSRESADEARAVADIVEVLVGAPLVDEHGQSRAARPDDVIVVTPYNAQRRRIEETLAARGLADVRVGTVDKFQGQEAFAVVYSMATSSDKDAPRGLSFLLDKNRFNVAISRCRALPIVVCSDALVESRCGSVDDMGLVSLLCSYTEQATPLSLSDIRGLPVAAAVTPASR